VFREPLPDAEELAGRARERFSVLGFDGFEVEGVAEAPEPPDLGAQLPAWLGNTPDTPEALAAAAREPAPTILPPTSSELIRLSRSRRATLAGRTYTHEARRRRLSRRARGQVLGLTTTLSLILAGASAAVLAAVAVQEVSAKETVPVAGGFPAVSFLGQDETFARGYPATAFLRNDSTLASTPPGGFVAATAKAGADRAGGGGESEGSGGSPSSEPPNTSVSDRPSEFSVGSSDRPSKSERSESKPKRQSSPSAPAPAPRRQAAPSPAPAPAPRQAPAPRPQAAPAPAPAPRQAPAPRRQPQPRIEPADPSPGGGGGGGDPSLGSSPSL
jgi:hypothetical protein